MFKRSSDQFNFLDANRVTSQCHSSFSLVNRLQLTHTVTMTIKIYRHQLFIFSEINNG